MIKVNKIRMMINTEKLVNNNKHFLVKMKLQMYQHDQIETLFDEKVDSDT